MTLSEGASDTSLTAGISPVNASNAYLSWTSSNAKVATVNAKGKVTARAAGTATITVTTEDGGYKATCKVTVKGTKPTDDPAACTTDGFCKYDGKDYWYEDGVRQGTVNDPKGVIGDGTNRGREIYDPESGAWYWLDSAYDGAIAKGKEVWMPYIFQNEGDADEAQIETWKQAANTYKEGPNGAVAELGDQLVKAINDRTGKWVRYDENGKLMKGWVKIEGDLANIYTDQIGNIYYYDCLTGLMAKGWTTIDGQLYYFDEITGVLQQ